MDLELLLADLSSRFDAQRREELETLGDELAGAERVGITLADRLRGAGGREMTVLLRGGGRVVGTVVDAAHEWFLLRGGRQESLIPCGAVVAAWPLGGVSGVPVSTVGGVRIGHALRELADLEVPVVVDHDAGIHHGVVAAVYADHFDLLASASVRGRDSRDLGGATRIAMSLGGIRRVSVGEDEGDLSR